MEAFLMEAFLLAVLGAVNKNCFVVGAKVGQTVTKGEDVKLPTVKPARSVPTQPPQEEEVVKDRFHTIMRNIDNYDGTEQGQEDVPWR